MLAPSSFLFWMGDVYLLYLDWQGVNHAGFCLFGFVGVWVIFASLCCFFCYSVGVSRFRAERSLSFLAKKKVTKESCLGNGE